MLKQNWFENNDLIELSKKCDESCFNQNEKLMQSLVDYCDKRAHNSSYSDMVRARYFYIAFTTQSDLIVLKMKNSSKNRIQNLKIYEKEFQKSLYLARNSFELLNNEISKNENMSNKQFMYMLNFKWQLSTNYSNFLYQNGRIIKAVEILSIFDIKKVFPMGMAQLGMKIYELSRYHYDSSHQKIMIYMAYQYIRRSCERGTSFPEEYEMKNMIERYKYDIISILGQDYLNHTFTIKDFLKSKDDLSDEETLYWEWVAKNKLALNPLNDIFDSVEVGYDPIHLPTMIEEIGSKKVQYLFGVFNQIKQEYVSARFLAYEGLMFRGTHFSDKDVYLINTLDYPVYGLGIEKIKACYRAAYSIFDKIAFFLNEYFDLGIKKHLGYIRVFSPDRNQNDKKKILDIAENNYPLFGMWWLFKDIRNININEDGTVNKTEEYKHIDNIMSKISKVRNAMEHGYLKILDSLIDDSRLDQIAYNISFADFEKLTLQLLKYVREAIILLVFSIKQEEEIKKSQLKSDAIVPSMYVDKYDDEWKQIFE